MFPNLNTYFTNPQSIMADHKGTAAWTGDIKGSGTLTTESGLLNAPYSVGSRFEGKPGTNPEELIGAAHAGCYTM